MRNYFWILALLIAANAHANYYRIFSGTRLASLSQDQYIDTLPSFLQKTIQLYEVDTKILGSYLVAVPPKDKPDFIPDEFALVDLHSQDEYNQVRNTPAGRAYGDAHWTLFERSRSGSTPYTSGPSLPANLSGTMAFDVIGQPTEWRSGYNTFFIGIKRPALTQEEYYSGMRGHIEHVAQAFSPMGLRAYIVLITPEYEVAFMNWESKLAADRAFVSAEGEEIRQESNRLLYFLQFSPATDKSVMLEGNSSAAPVGNIFVNFGNFYQVLK